MENRLRQTITKKTFIAHTRCPKLAWWLAHEPDAPETRLTTADYVRLRQGEEVGRLARSYVPAAEQGYLIERSGRNPEALQTDTTRALERHDAPIYEGAFIVDDIMIFTDILLPTPEGWTLVEVKSGTSVTEEHILDAAFQLLVLDASRIRVARIEIMYLNRECRFPDLATLFVREDVTDRVATLNAFVRDGVAALQSVLANPVPKADIGDHCSKPVDCPFKARCWPVLPDHHVSTLYRIQKKKVEEYVRAGYHTVADLPDDLKLSAIPARQRRAVREGALVVEREALTAAMTRVVPPVAHLDFETVQLPVPRWPGCKPYDQVPVQVSCHVVDGNGTVTHHAWIADGPEDPRRTVAEVVLMACAEARTVTAYYAPFEQSRLRELAEVCPDLGDDLTAIAESIVDLLPVIRDNLYHPDFGGSFSLKKVLPALVPSLTYDDLEIRDGATASAELLRLMFGATDAGEPDKLRQALLAYCERDTAAMVALANQLTELCQPTP